ncbi:MAG: phage holin [Clostridia bacterium]|nr:phage holin [Clostridia bacterium]
MNWKNRLKNYNFWISMFSAILLILQALKLEFDVAYVNEIFTAVLGLLVVVGIIIDPTKTATSKVSSEEQSKDSVPTEETAQKTSLPIDEKNEDNININENDFKTALNKISLDLENKINELVLKNQQSEQHLIEMQKEANIKLKEENSSPAAAEMENPYIDLMK